MYRIPHLVPSRYKDASEIINYAILDMFNTVNNKADSEVKVAYTLKLAVGDFIIWLFPDNGLTIKRAKGFLTTRTMIYNSYPVVGYLTFDADRIPKIIMSFSAALLQYIGGLVYDHLSLPEDALVYSFSIFGGDITRVCLKIDYIDLSPFVLSCILISGSADTIIDRFNSSVVLEYGAFRIRNVQMRICYSMTDGILRSTDMSSKFGIESSDLNTIIERTIDV